MINDGANPLAEVALALAMAFFSLMILMLFAMVNAPKADATDVGPATMEMAVESRDPPPDDEERHLVIFTDAVRDVLGANLVHTPRPGRCKRHVRQRKRVRCVRTQEPLRRVSPKRRFMRPPIVLGPCPCFV